MPKVDTIIFKTLCTLVSDPSPSQFICVSRNYFEKCICVKYGKEKPWIDNKPQAFVRRDFTPPIAFAISSAYGPTTPTTVTNTAATTNSAATSPTTTR